jgi:hypothetical protein
VRSARLLCGFRSHVPLNQSMLLFYFSKRLPVCCRGR